MAAFNVTQKPTHTPLLPEIPINLSLRLKRHHSGSEALATFTCITSKLSVGVFWYKDGNELLSCRKYELHEVGHHHYLTIHDLCMSDFGDYVVVIGSRRSMMHPTLEGLFILSFVL